MSRTNDIVRLLVEQLRSKEEEALRVHLNHRAADRELQLSEPGVRLLNNNETWWLAKLESGHLLMDRGWPIQLRAAEMTDDYIKKCRRWNVSKRGAATSMGRFLSKVCPNIRKVSRQALVVIESGRYKPGTANEVMKRVRFYQFPNLEHCRATWDVRHGPTDWDSIDAQQAAAAAE